MKICLSKLKEHCPLDCSIWHIYPAITKKEISDAIVAQMFETNPVEEYPWDVELNQNRDLHIRRIAYFVEHGWSDNIELDVGFLYLGCDPGWIIEDGNHRYLAACFRNDEFIDVEYSGSVDLFEDMFLI